jgi:predicted Zn-dependent protease
MNEIDLRERKEFLKEVEAFLNKGDYLMALGLAESRQERTPGDLDARIVICRVWIEQGRLEEAGEMLREMEDILTSLSQIYICMGDICIKKGMPESAQVFYRAFVSLNPDTPMAQEISERLKGISEQHATDDGARAEKEEAAQVLDDFQTVTLAELYVRQGHLQMAEEVLEAILRKDPHDVKATEMLREVRERIVSRKEPEEKHAPVIAELSRWLKNIGRLRSHAA